MLGWKRRVLAVACVLITAFFPIRAHGQSSTSGAIAGEVTDTSGAALPGVTVEAGSPALIEKVRSVVTDGQGRYNIVTLPTGVYTVAFSLPGFSTFKREAIELTTGFTARVDAQMISTFFVLRARAIASCMIGR